MKLLRRIHLYLGCFFAPILLFFVCSGWYQTMHPDRRKSPGEAEAILDRMRSVHADSLLPSDSAAGYHPAAFRAFVALMAACLIITLIIGVVLAVKFGRPRWLVWVTLILGVLIPVFLLILGQQPAD